MAKSDVIRQAWAELEPQLAKLGFELIEVEYGGAGGQSALRLFLDKEGGITLDDCAEASRMLGPILDAADFVPGHYMLEVSSPGLDRPVRKPDHFQQYIGERVKVKTHTPVQGRRNFRGELTAFEDGLIALECDGTAYEIHIENLDRANLIR